MQPDFSTHMSHGYLLHLLATQITHSRRFLSATDDMHVRPLYLHMFPPAYGPSLCFIGLPWRCAKVPQFQLQGQLLARLLAGKVQLPSVPDMQQVLHWL